MPPDTEIKKNVLWTSAYPHTAAAKPNTPGEKTIAAKASDPRARPA